MPASLPGPTSPQHYSHVPTWPGTSLGTRHWALCPLFHCVTHCVTEESPAPL